MTATTHMIVSIVQRHVGTKKQVALPCMGPEGLEALECVSIIWDGVPRNQLWRVPGAGLREREGSNKGLPQ
jgi:hypothetical protein